MAAKKSADLTVVEGGSTPVATPTESMASLAFLERLMANPDVSLERVEHAWAIHQRMQGDLARKAFDAAFAQMQPELPVIEEKGKSNTGKYAKWEDVVEAIQPVLAKHGFGLSFRTMPSPVDPARIRTTAILSHAQGHREENFIDLPPDKSGNKHDIHAIASSTSYGARYSACPLLNIISRDIKDDDGRAAAGDAPLSKEQVKVIRNLLRETRTDEEGFLANIAKCDNVEDIRAAAFPVVSGLLETKKRNQAEAEKRKAETPV